MYAFISGDIMLTLDHFTGIAITATRPRYLVFFTHLYRMGSTLAAVIKSLLVFTHLSEPTLSTGVCALLVNTLNLVSVAAFATTVHPVVVHTHCTFTTQ